MIKVLIDVGFIKILVDIDSIKNTNRYWSYGRVLVVDGIANVLASSRYDF